MLYGIVKSRTKKSRPRKCPYQLLGSLRSRPEVMTREKSSSVQKALCGAEEGYSTGLGEV